MPPSRDPFETTRWSLVIAAGGSDSNARREALGTLIQTYWFPLYGYIRRRGHDSDAADDVLQSFLLSLIERGDLSKLSPDRGRFRAFVCRADTARQGTVSQFHAQLEAVHEKFKNRFPNSSHGWNDPGGMRVRLTGVGFFDRQHGQTGRARNQLELHPSARHRVPR